ncbi:Phox homologous domain [Pseudocohnilembus persalinus]|uniref:Phox homologous domain n=1 Tax=Pseudocohnilembus persalinus TaxID=266149 RepID=A0A0V0QS49_PSEPJ|nr:Phox homologous domain [Pseudocohnilembus persalinus]|eukprot:KRX05005.1 Phox homologous domain [Pseudocohnilembus persalinus]
MNLDGEFQQQQEQGNSGEYVLQEYLYNQLPIYFFLIAGVVRYKEIIDKPIKVTPEQHEKQKYNKAIISHIIKKQLSKTVAILYLVSTTMSLVLPNTTTFYYGARHKWGALVYFLASCTWFFSIQVLKLEYFRELSQSLYCHRIFWPFSACFQIISIFQDYKALPETLLMFYAIYKPYDDIQQYIENQGDLPTFARQFIEKLESNRIVFFILGIKNQPLNDLEETLMPDENNLGQKIDISELQNYIPKQKYQQVEQERYLFNQLPRVAIAINQKIIVKQENSQQRFYYHIITQIGQNKYDTQQNYQEILNLESELHKIYKDVITKKFPKLEKTKMLSHESQEQYLSRRIQVLEQWFKLLIKEPLFMHQILLEFLNVDQNDQHPFITYFKLVVNTNPQYFSNIGLQAINNPAGGQINDPKFSNLNSNNQNQNQKSSSTIEMANLEFNRKKKKDRFQKAIEERKDDMEFDVSCTGFEKGKYGIWENYPDVPLVWRINKSFTDIKDFNEKLEYELSSMNQIYRNNLSHLELKNKNDANELQEKQQGIDKYMKFLLDNKYYWNFAGY